MRRWAMVLGAAAALGASACLPSTDPGPTGRLLYRRDSATCTSPSTTELFINGTSLGQYVIAPGGQQGFNVAATTHIVNATEVGATARQFLAQAVNVPAGGSAVYVMACATTGPPDAT
ncbi:MAG: hypothetical protein Q8Q85_16260 [Gemmatimonadales bacterium]|nr:hypothetical protein [Gemmatimonadales bacterium]